MLYHVLVFGLEDTVVLEEVQSRYDGEVVLANDLDVFDYMTIAYGKRV